MLKNKKRILILAILCLVIIIELIALGISKANNVKEIKITFLDNQELIKEEVMNVSATDSGDAGYYIVLPRVVNEKIVSLYHIEQKELTTEDDESETTTVIEKRPGEVLYISDEEVESLSSKLTITYDTKLENDVLLYNRLFSNQIDESSKVELEGYVPLNVEVTFETITEDVSNQVLEVYPGELKYAQTIKLIDEEKKEYTNTEELKLTFNNLVDEYIYRLLEIDNLLTPTTDIVDLSDDYSLADGIISIKLKKLKSYIVIDETALYTQEEITDIAIENQIALFSMSNVVTSGVKWEGNIATSFSYGDGSESLPYLIADGDELAYLAEQVNAGNTYEGKYFKLANDINLNNLAWTPIGNYSNSFRGNFDGAGHTISNAIIVSNSTHPTNTMYTYGIFGSIGGGDTRAYIYNLQITGVDISLAASGNLSGSTQKGYSIGFVTGTMFKNSTISNVIVTNSTVTSANTIQIRSNANRVLVGGIAGEVLSESTMSTSPSNPGENAWYSIDNCYVKATFELANVTTNGRSYAAQYSVGGIIGRIRNQGRWPTNCLFEGDINANGFIGPIFGTLLTSSSYGTSQYNGMWNGNNYSSLTTNSYYTNYSVNGKSFTTSVTSGTASNAARYSTNTSNIGYVQGVNKGIYTSDISNLLSDFNSRSDENITWEYVNGEFSLVPRLTATIEEVIDFNYEITVDDEYNVGNYTYKWYVNGELDETLTSNTTVIDNESFEEDKNIVVVISDGTYNTVVKYSIPRLYIAIEFNVNKTTKTITGILTGTALKYVDQEDYTFTWYKEDISGLETEKIEGETSISISNLSTEYDYKLVATNNKIAALSAQNSTSLVDRSVIYVNYSSGSDDNDGLTDKTPVKNLKEAYERLAYNTINQNVIVLIGDYTNTDYLYATANNYSTVQGYYNKPAILTGIYKSTDYSAGLYIGTSDTSNGGTYIFNDTKFMHMNFYGSTTFGGTGSTFMYAQGNSLTIGKGVTMQRYKTSSASTNALANGTAPDFHIICAFLNHNSTTLGDANKGTLTINSGTFARIISGSRNTKVNSTSNNFTGSSTENFEYKIIVDIDESTTSGNYTHDINQMVGGQTDGNIYANMDIEVRNGNIARIIGGSIGYSREIPNNPCNTFFGKTKITVSGGTVNELYGGSLGRYKSDVYYYGNMEVNITGGTVNNNIYGVGAGGVAGYDENSTDPYKSLGKSYTTTTTINISGGTINGNIYGGGYGYSQYLDASTIATDGGALYGNSYINITGGTINGDIYGAGKGYSGYSGRTTLAQMKGNTSIVIKSPAIVKGTIYGAGEGVSGYADMAKLIGNTNIDIQNDISTNIYGAGNISKVEGTTNVKLNSGNLTTDVYGGGNEGSVDGTANVILNGGTCVNLYAGGKSAGVTNTNVTLNDSKASTIYGGSNVTGDVSKSTINLLSGTVDIVYGGNNVGGTTISSNVILNGTYVTNAIYGGGNQVAVTESNIDLIKSVNDVPAIYGGGYQAGVATTNIECNGATIQNIYGGSNVIGNTTNSNITVNSGKITNIYGGNNLGGTTTTTNITTNDGNVQNIFGGGKEAEATYSNILTQGGNIENIYGGGEDAGLTNSYVNLMYGKITNVYGGSNLTGTVENTSVISSYNKDDFRFSTSTGSVEGLDINIEATTRATDTWETTEYSSYVTLNITLTNTTQNDINEWSAYFITKDAMINSNYSNTEIAQNGDTFTFNQVNRYYGNNVVSAGGTYSFEITMYSKSTPEEFEIDYGVGSPKVESKKDENDEEVTGELVVGNIFGGNNQGGLTSTSDVIIKSGKINNIYGGGDNAITNSTNVYVGATVLESVYGGGNMAGVTTNTVLDIENANITGNVYGGGNEGTVSGNTEVNILNSILNSSAYAGGNGSLAVVEGNANISVQGNTNIKNSVFGGGNRAATGTEENNNSISTVNISGGNIGKNVYGGANTSVVFGNTKINIGTNAISDIQTVKGNIGIEGTVFGGGEANEEGSEIYDFSYISVTKGIDINIDVDGYGNFYIRGSIFGSGNASSTTGISNIYINNYGTIDEPEKNISIQRANEVVLNNSSIALSGTTDRTNEYSDVKFTISRVDSLKLKNNSYLYLDCGANLLKNMYSMVDIDSQETLGTVSIEEETGEIVKNVDNRIYLKEGKVLNIATNEQVTSYGNVYGMFFLGMYTNSNSPSTSNGLYNHNFKNGDDITNMGTFSTNSYVLAMHKTDHDTKVDGFYTSSNNGGKIKNEYIEVTPEDDLYYIWSVGDALDVTVFEISLTASKYATLGTYELPLTGFSVANTKFVLSGFSAGLNEGISLVDKSEIDAIDQTNENCDTKFGLGMRSGKNGWTTNSETYFYTRDGGTHSGNTEYNADNSNYTPTLAFYLYHSQNLSIEQELGSAKIRFTVLTPIDDLTYAMSYIDVNITMSTALFQDDYYEAAISPGQEFELFNTTETVITDDSALSMYYSLYVEKFSKSKYYSSYDNLDRVLISRDASSKDLVFKENTKLTLIDLVTDTTYYYVVSNTDEANNKNKFSISEFKKMGSVDEVYDKEIAKDKYYDEITDILYESYILHVDFSEASIDSDIVDASILIELQDKEAQTLIGVLGIQRDTTKYSVYKDKEAVIDVEATLSTEKLYLGEELSMDVTTDFTQSIIQSKTIYDTKYFDEQMGIKITWLDSNGNQLSSDSLLGLKITLDGNTYYPRIDGSTRINIAERVSNILSRIKFDTSKNSTLATGTYTIKVESFGSSDGIYYGLEASDSVQKEVYIINSSYGLDVYLDDKSIFVDKENGNTLYGNNTILSHINYSSSLKNPVITVSLQRRDYSSAYSLLYKTENLTDYFTNSLTKFKENEYIVSTSPTASSTFFLNIKAGVKTGTYKLVFKLYDSDTYIGEATEYFIVR